MAISTETRRSDRYACDGVQTAFPFAFKVFKADEIGVIVSPDGETETTLSSELYTVSLNEDQDNDPGGVVNLLTAPADGTILVVVSNVAYKQQIVFTNQGGFYPELLNEGYDRLTILTQQLKEHLDRTITVPPTSPTSPQELFYQLLNAAKEALESAQSAEEALAACEQIRQLIEQYSWDIPHIVDSLRDVENYPYDGFFAIRGFGNPGNPGHDISNRLITIGGVTAPIGDSILYAAGLTPKVFYVSTAGTGNGESDARPMSLESAIGLLALYTGFAELRFAPGTYSLSQTISFDSRKIKLTGQAGESNSVFLDFSDADSYGIYAKDSETIVSNITIKSATFDGLRIDGGKVYAENCEFNNCSHSGFSATGNASFYLLNCKGAENAWNGFSFARNSNGNVVSCLADNNTLYGFHPNYCGNIYFYSCKAQECQSGYFVSGCTSAYLNDCQANNNEVAGVLGSGLCRISAQNSSVKNNPRGWMAEYGADITLCDCDTDGDRVGPSSDWAGVVSEYGSRVTVAFGSKVSDLKNYSRGLYALNGGRIDLWRPVSSLLSFTNVSIQASPDFGHYGNSGGFISCTASNGLTSLEAAFFHGQLGDATAKGSIDLNTLVDSGVYTCDAGSTNKPADFGQVLVSVYKRATTNSTRKIVQTVYDLGTVAMAFRYGACLNGDDSNITWTNYQKITTSAA